MENIIKKATTYYSKYKEMINYLIFGVLTTAVNYLSYALFARLLNFSVIISTVIAWILSVIFAYITNKLYVFESKSFEKKILIREIITFTSARIFSGVLDVFNMYIFVDIFKMNDLVIKLLSNVMVIIVNYVLSKLVIFKKK